MAKKQITALQVLSKMDSLQRIKESPSMPPNYIIGTKYKETCANDIEKAIERFAKIVGFLAERTKTQCRLMEAKWIDTPNGRVQTQKATFVTSTSRKGSSDMKLLIKGLGSVYCEIKYGKDRQSVDQKKYQADVERNGGTYLIIKTFEEFMIWYVSLYGRPEIMNEAIKELK